MTALPQPFAPAPELSATGRVILGMIGFGKTTGYDIKAFVDKTTRYFWAVSYGQNYPELKRLEDQGLIHGRPEPSGGRARTVYQLTDGGRAALLSWLASDEEPVWEMRCEGMLKLFFSDALPERRVENIRAMRERDERTLAGLRALESHAQGGRPGPYSTLQLGIGMTQWFVDWCKEAEQRLSEPEGSN